MFQFGLFATHLPHIIIAAAYMIYFGTCALDECHPNNLEREYDEAKIIQTIESNKIASAVSFYDVFKVNYSGSDALKKAAIYSEKVHKIFQFFEQPLYDRYPGCNIFSRPPPSC